MTKRPRGAVGKTETVPLSYRLPTAHITQLAGLMEAVAAEPYNGRADLPEIADQMGFGVDQLFPLLEALEILCFAHTEGGDVELTASGKSYVDADILCRKEIFAEHVIRHVSLAAHIAILLMNAPAIVPQKTVSYVNWKISSVKMRLNVFYRLPLNGVAMPNISPTKKGQAC